MASVQESAASALRALPGVARAVRSLVAIIRREARIRADERHLRQLPDAMLRDIGIHRSEVREVIRGGQARG